MKVQYLLLSSFILATTSYSSEVDYSVTPFGETLQLNIGAEKFYIPAQETGEISYSADPFELKEGEYEAVDFSVVMTEYETFATHTNIYGMILDTGVFHIGPAATMSVPSSYAQDGVLPEVQIFDSVGPYILDGNTVSIPVLERIEPLVRYEELGLNTNDYFLRESLWPQFYPVGLDLTKDILFSTSVTMGFDTHDGTRVSEYIRPILSTRFNKYSLEMDLDHIRSKLGYRHDLNPAWYLGTEFNYTGYTGGLSDPAIEVELGAHLQTNFADISRLVVEAGVITDDIIPYSSYSLVGDATYSDGVFRVDRSSDLTSKVTFTFDLTGVDPNRSLMLIAETADGDFGRTTSRDLRLSGSLFSIWDQPLYTRAGAHETENTRGVRTADVYPASGGVQFLDPYFILEAKERSIYNEHHTDDPTVRTRNTDSWFYELDLTPFPFYEDSSGRGVKAGGLITRKHLIQAQHYHNNVGDEVWFCDNDNVIHTRIVTAAIDVSKSTVIGNVTTDLALIEFDRELPDSIAHCKIFPADVLDHLKGGMAGMVFGMLGQTDGFYLTSSFMTHSIGNYPGKSIPNFCMYDDILNEDFDDMDYRSLYTRTGISQTIGEGDSSSPVIFFLEGSPVLLSALSTVGYFPPINEHIDTIEAALLSLGSDLKLDIIDLTKYEE